MPNNRIFYASHGVEVGPAGGSLTTVQGAQSVGVTTNFNLEQAFQLGQLAIYNNIVTDPEVEITITKALDGEATIWNLATGGGSIINNANERTDVVLGVGSDTAASLTSTAAVTMTGLYVSSLTYTMPVDGSFTEDVTLVGNSKTLNGSVSAPSISGATILRRQNLQITGSTLPVEVQGKNLSSITISTDFGRESLYKLGEYAPFYRSVSFPIEVTCEIEVIATTTDEVACNTSGVGCAGFTGVPEQPISINLCNSGGSTYYTFNLGTKNRLQSVNYTGGDTGGGNVSITYSYSTYNDLDITG